LFCNTKTCCFVYNMFGYNAALAWSCSRICRNYGFEKFVYLEFFFCGFFVLCVIWAWIYWVHMCS
jgi:hypothetical protein